MWLFLCSIISSSALLVYFLLLIVSMILKQSHILCAALLHTSVWQILAYLCRLYPALGEYLDAAVRSPDAVDDADVHFVHVFVFFTATGKLQWEQLPPTKQKSRKKMFNFIRLKSYDPHNSYVIKCLQLNSFIWNVAHLWTKTNYILQCENWHYGSFQAYVMYMFLAHFVVIKRVVGWTSRQLHNLNA